MNAEEQQRRASALVNDVEKTIFAEPLHINGLRNKEKMFAVREDGQRGVYWVRSPFEQCEAALAKVKCLLANGEPPLPEHFKTFFEEATANGGLIAFIPDTIIQAGNGGTSEFGENYATYDPRTSVHIRFEIPYFHREHGQYCSYTNLTIVEQGSVAENGESFAQRMTEAGMGSFVEAMRHQDLSNFNPGTKQQQMDFFSNLLKMNDKRCGACHTSGSTKRCTVCKLQCYCCVECQHLHWSEHRTICPALKVLGEHMTLAATGVLSM